MNKKEKREFLSMDLIERLIRLEQKISASFGEFLSYSETEYFKHLSEDEKKKFAKYLVKNKRRKYILGFFISLVVFGIALFYGEVTAGVIGVKSIIEGKLYSSLFFGGLAVFIIWVGINLISKGRRARKLKSHFNILDNVYIKKHKK